MQNQTELHKISCFLAHVGPFLICLLRAILTGMDFEVEAAGRGLNASFEIKSGKLSMSFQLHNLFMEIATQDRDAEELCFDERLRDFNYFMHKSSKLIDSKLRILLPLLRKDDVDAAFEEITAMADQYERIRIWKFDQNEPSQTAHGN